MKERENNKRNGWNMQTNAEKEKVRKDNNSHIKRKQTKT
jgi:hypothetical protein